MIDLSIKNARILIVDDNEYNIAMLEALLEESGYIHFKSTADPREVVSLYLSYSPDLILLDLMMPYLNGYEVMDLLKAKIGNRALPQILVLTADVTPEAKLRALSGGARDFLSKPFNAIEIQLRIKNLLENHYLHLQLENQNQILEEKVKERTTELYQANLKLDLANEELASLESAKNDFLFLISHEIRTPLNGILGFTSVLKDEINTPELLEYIAHLEDSAQRLEAFSYKALLITELRTEKRKIAWQVVHLNELIDRTKESVAEKMRSKGVSIHIQLEESINEIHGDWELLQICFDQLVDNLVKFSPTNDDVILKVFPDNEFIVCEFVDNGSGFIQEILNKPFQIFSLGDAHIDQNTGLNLALIKLIMDAHQGNIEVFNHLPHGATVRLTLKK